MDITKYNLNITKNGVEVTSNSLNVELNHFGKIPTGGIYISALDDKMYIGRYMEEVDETIDSPLMFGLPYMIKLPE